MTKITIVVDEREHDLYSELMKQKPEDLCVSKEMLVLGDILLKTIEEDGTEKIIIIIERKTFNDLISSVKDGRYDEQSHRLIHTSEIPLHNIIYLLEGMLSQIHEKNKKLVYSCITSLNYFKGFSVFRTCNIRETTDLILGMTNKIQKDYIKKKEEVVIQVPENYCNVVKKVKKDNITPNNICEIILCQIPGISTKTAISISKPFNSFSDFMKKIETDFKYLEELKIEGSNGKLRKLNKTIIQNIQNYLLNSNPSNPPLLLDTNIELELPK
jgi:ERCC4-type nuclease